MQKQHRLFRLRRKAYVPIAIALVVAGGLAACSSGGGSASSDKIKLVAWEFLNGPDTPSATKIINEFNKSQSKVEVVDTQLSFDALQQKLLTGIASGNGPDIVTLGEDALSKFVSKGALSPVDDFYSNPSAYPNGQVLVKASTDGAKINGKSYGIPLNFYDALMCYNKDIFAKAGVEPPKTWDDFAKIAEKLTILQNGKPVQYAIALGDQADGNRFYPPLLWNGGGGVVSDDGKKALLDDPKTIAALEFWVDLVRNKQVSPVGDDGPAAEALFNAGKAAIVPCGPWVVGTATAAHINLGLAPMPSGPAGNFPWSGSLVWTVPKTDSPEVKKAAYEFANFWNSKASQVIFSTANGYPSTRTDLAPSDITGNPYVSIFGAPDVLKNAKFYLPGLANGTEINNEVFTPALQKALAGEGTVKDIFTAANKQAQALLDKK